MTLNALESLRKLTSNGRDPVLYSLIVKALDGNERARRQIARILKLRAHAVLAGVEGAGPGARWAVPLPCETPRLEERVAVGGAL